MIKNSTDMEKKTIIWIVILTAFVTTFTGSALNLSIPDISSEFGISAGTVGWLVTGYTLAVAAFSVPFGRIADITCRKTVLVTGIAIFVACCIAAVFSVSVSMLIISRIIQGIGAAMIFSTNTAVLIDSFSQKRRGQMLGYSLAATYAGMSAGPAVGGFLNHHFGWRTVFVLTGILGAAALAVSILRLPGKKAEYRAGSEDIPGCIMYVIFIILMMYGLSEAGNGVLPYAIIVLGMITGIIFVRHELRTCEPAVRVRMLKENVGYAFSNLAAMMNYGATFAISYLISIYLQIIMGYTSQAAGIIMICQPAVIALFTPLAGKASDRISPFKLACAGMIICAAGTGIFIFIDQGTSVFVIAAVLVISGIGISLFSSPNTNAVMSCVSKEDYGVASSLLATMRAVGNTLSMVIVTVTVRQYVGAVSLMTAEPEELMKVVSVSFIVFTAICAAGAIISLKR